jgi:hypothetical protein
VAGVVEASSPLLKRWDLGSDDAAVLVRLVRPTQQVSDRPDEGGVVLLRHSILWDWFLVVVVLPSIWAGVDLARAVFSEVAR